MRPGAAEDLTGAFSQIRRLAHYYRDQPWKNIREHEARTFLVIPLLLALGWAEQQIKIEYPVERNKRADIVCFSRPYSQPDKQCEIVIETKDFKTGLDFAPDQAKWYGEKLGSNIVAVTNGYCYKIYGRDPNGKFMLHAYLNIFSPTDIYPRDDTIEGALEVFRLLLPQMSNRSIF